MITINTNKGLVKVELWEDIESRPGFVKDLSPADEKLDSIIGRYIFKEKIRCGLSNCHTPHSKGYIVSTTNGHETNIGKDCGKTYFGVDFETLSKKFDRDITESENREKLCSFSFKIEELEKKINDIRKQEKGADWSYKLTQTIINRNRECPDEIVHIITSMIKSRSNILSKQRLASEQEIEDIEAIENRTIEPPYYIDEQIAEIIGFEALYPENDIRKLLVKDLESNIREFKEKDIGQLSYNDLRHYTKWIDTIENTLEKAEAIVIQARKLFVKDNLEPLIKTLKDQGDIRLFRGYLKRF